ncbi:MAG: cellobiose 2-epimerase [Bacteroidia bacterium]
MQATQIHTLLQGLAASARHMLHQEIMPFWTGSMVDPLRGGFHGRMDSDGQIDLQAPRSAVLCTRILWTASAVWLAAPRAAYRDMARRALHYLEAHFRDPLHGGIYWQVDAQGRAQADRKQIYAQAFAIYALAAHYQAFGEPQVLEWAVGLFDDIERHSYDRQHNGYHEAFARDWGPLADLRLSDKDANEARTMNTHLHVLEAYTQLYRVWPDAWLADRLRNLLHIFLDRILAPGGDHLDLFFGEDWSRRSDTVSFGHDIEASWLLTAAASVLGDAALAARVPGVALQLVDATLARGFDSDGALFNELHGGRLDDDKHWWPQAEAIIGLLDAYAHRPDPVYLQRAGGLMQVIQTRFVDRATGEWYFRLDRSGQPYRQEDLAGPWKGPYHNGRACLEIDRRCYRLLAG